MTFVYDGDRIFEVSIYGLSGCKEVRAVTEVEDVEEDSIVSLSSDDDTDTTVVRDTNKGKKKEKAVESSAEDSDSDYVESFDRLDLEESSDSESWYASDSKDTATGVKPKAQNLKKGGGSTRMKKVRPKIKNPESYLDNPKNVYFETAMKKRKSELIVCRQVVKDYSLEFQKKVEYIDNHKEGNLVAGALTWGDKRVCIKRWFRICKRNKVKERDRVLCELFRKGCLVYAVRLHIVREKDL
ncbi:unnamed protein product [Thlaspi arvense]|uniref:B3 domain-containing protein n=1 Tax=Thlaspi arvense TaxID=13288 RepID=A0AAU9T3B4_THLAR|nr:unnamed protein product [Thlaspi arvense]